MFRCERSLMSVPASAAAFSAVCCMPLLVGQPRQHVAIVVASDCDRADVCLPQSADTPLQRSDRLPELVVPVDDVTAQAHNADLLLNRQVDNPPPSGSSPKLVTMHALRHPRRRAPEVQVSGQNQSCKSVVIRTSHCQVSQIIAHCSPTIITLLLGSTVIAGPHNSYTDPYINVQCCELENDYIRRSRTSFEGFAGVAAHGQPPWVLVGPGR